MLNDTELRIYTCINGKTHTVRVVHEPTKLFFETSVVLKNDKGDDDRRLKNREHALFLLERKLAGK